MKIPTKHSNTKHLAVIAGALALVGGVSVPLIATAHGGEHGQTTAQHRVWNGGLKHGTDKQKSDHHGWSWFGQHEMDADKFAERNTKLLAKLDKFITDKKLTVENAALLKADLSAKADALKTELEASSELHTELDGKTDLSSEERAKVKAQAMAIFEASYDYKLALHDYTAAIKAAAKAAGVKYSL